MFALPFSESWLDQYDTGLTPEELKQTIIGGNYLKCKRCSTVFKKLHRLKDHLLKHDNKRPYSCKECDMSYRNEASLRDHMFKRHLDIYPMSPNM